MIGPPIAGQAGDQERRQVDGEDVGGGEESGPREPRAEQGPATQRPDHEGLEKTRLGVAPRHAERQEHRQHGAEEQGREHRQPEDRRAGERGRVEDPLGAGEMACVAEGEVSADAV